MLKSSLIFDRHKLDVLKQPFFWVFFALVVLYIPSYHAVYLNVWSDPDQAHGPLVFLVIAYLFFSKREVFSLSENPALISGWSITLFGLLLYILGRSQDISILDLSSQIFLFSGLILILKGWSTLRRLWFPIFFIFFMLPLPGFVVSAITMPMKIAVSTVAEHVLYWLDYPIARSGVILQIGQYQLFVADACAGLHTLVSLEALGLLYLNLVKHDSLFRNITLALLIIPISFTANTIRVIAISLVTFYFGDEVGQGFIHGFAGILLFIIALCLIIFIDSVLQVVSEKYFKGKPINASF